MIGLDRLATVFASTVLLALLVACSDVGKSSSASSASGPYVYDETAIDDFITQCVEGASITQCTCLLDRYREVYSQDALSVAPSAAEQARRASFAAECGMAAGAVDSVAGAATMASSATAPMAPPASANLPQASNSASAVSAAPAAPPKPRDPGLPPPPPRSEAGVVKPASTGEKCMQEKMAEEQEKLAGKPVPIDLFDRIRKECGL